MNNDNYSIIIPAYNAGNTLDKLLDQICQITEEADEILVVNDGSTDNTPDIARNSNVTLIDHSANSGKGHALKEGFAYFKKKNYDGFLLCLDADLQHPPELIPEFLKKIRETKSLFIIGNRDKKPGKMPFHRILSNKITSGIISLLTGQKIKDSQCGYRLIHTDVLYNLVLTENGFQLESEMILKAADNNIRIEFVDIPVIYNNRGSHIGNVRDTIRFILMIFKYLFRSDKG